MLKSVYATLFLLVGTSFMLTAQSNYKIADNTKNDGKVEWKRNIQVGDIPYGIPYSVDFPVKNLTEEPLILINVKAGCHCTVVDYTRDAILPGGTGYIKTTYDAKKAGDFYKVISVTTNFDPDNSVVISMQGKVVE